jgi:hypothetical protein
MPTTAGGFSVAIDTAKWRLEGMQQELISIECSQVVERTRLRLLEEGLAALSSSEDEDEGADEFEYSDTGKGKAKASRKKP